MGDVGHRLDQEFGAKPVGEMGRDPRRVATRWRVVDTTEHFHASTMASTRGAGHGATAASSAQIGRRELMT
jgi:hypothetical protein